MLFLISNILCVLVNAYRRKKKMQSHHGIHNPCFISTSCPAYLYVVCIFLYIFLSLITTRYDIWVHIIYISCICTQYKIESCCYCCGRYCLCHYSIKRKSTMETRRPHWCGKIIRVKRNHLVRENFFFSFFLTTTISISLCQLDVKL